MGKTVFIAEKPSVAREFANALKINTKKYDGYLESENTIVTWCVGHLVTMSYPDAYDSKYKKWSFTTLPFLPDTCGKAVSDREPPFEPCGRRYHLCVYGLRT